MGGVKVELKGRDELLEQLRIIKKAIKNPEPLFKEIGAALVTSTDTRFEEEQDPDGNPWPQSLRALQTGGKTLTDTAKLSGSITFEASDDGVAIGTNVIYAAIHQFGGTIKAKTKRGLRFRAGGNSGWVTKMSVDIPQRAFLGVSDDDQETIENIGSDWLARSIGDAAL
jgi:phage virion morphogenesis protein